MSVLWASLFEPVKRIDVILIVAVALSFRELLFWWFLARRD
jgi:hypothetical protein